MANTLAAVLQLQVNLSLGNNLVIGSASYGSATASLVQQLGVALVNGTAAGQADVPYWATRQLAASASEQLDLAGTTLKDPYGNNVSMARLKALIVTADPANTNNVVVGGGSNAIATLFGSTTHTTIVRPGALVSWLAGQADSTGYVVTPATADLLQIANSGAGTPVNYSIIAVGAST